MKFTMPEHVQAVIDAAKEIGIELTLVGGALRDAVLGGDVSDYDLVFFSDHDSMYTHIMELDRDLGFTLQHHTPYEGEDGFVFDMRKDDINIIMYNEVIVDNAIDLIAKFDLNINQFFLSKGNNIINNRFDGMTVHINPYRDALGHTERLGKRVKRFADKYPNLDWSAPMRMVLNDAVEKMFL